MTRDRRGSVLLEAVVAMVVLATSGMALVELVRQTTAATRQAREAEERAVAADQFLHAVALWTTSDLDRHLGNHPNGRWRLEVQRLPALGYEVQLYDSAGHGPLLATFLRQSDRDR